MNTPELIVWWIAYVIMPYSVVVLCVVGIVAMVAGTVCCWVSDWRAHRQFNR